MPPETSAAAAQLEGSKGFMKDILAKYRIPTAAYGRFTDAAAAKKGAIAPFGGPKGYALGIAFEVLVASLAASAITSPTTSASPPTPSLASV